MFVTSTPRWHRCCPSSCSRSCGIPGSWTGSAASADQPGGRPEWRTVLEQAPRLHLQPVRRRRHNRHHRLGPVVLGGLVPDSRVLRWAVWSRSPSPWPRCCSVLASTSWSPPGVGAIPDQQNSRSGCASTPLTVRDFDAFAATPLSFVDGEITACSIDGNIAVCGI
jgi:hypothetical protein